MPTNEVQSGEIPSTPLDKRTKAGKAEASQLGTAMGSMPAGLASEVPEGKIMVDSSVLEQMNQRLMAAEAKLSGAAPTPAKRVAAHDARLMFVDDKYPVIEFGKCFNKHNPATPQHPELWIPFTVLLDPESGKTENREAEYLKLMNDNPRYLADIKNQKVEVRTLPQGVKATHWTTVNPDPAGISGGGNFQPRQIVLEHTVPSYHSLIEFREGPMNGVEIEVSNDCLNP